MEDKKHSFMDQLNLFFIGNELLTCEHCVNYKHWPSKCRYFGCWGHVPINCYFKLVK